MEFSPRESVYTNIEKEKLIRILYSIWDIQQALSALTFLLEECDFDQNYRVVDLRRFRCYEANMVISFGRAFESSRKYSSISLKTVGIKLSGKERELQKKLLDTRRKIVAHSDSEMMHMRSTTFTVSAVDGMVVPHIVHDEALNFDKEELFEFEAFFRALRHYIHEFVFELTQRRPSLMEFYKKPKHEGEQED